MFNRH